MKFEQDKSYGTDDVHLLSRLVKIRETLNSMHALDYNQRRDMAHILFLLEESMVDITSMIDIAGGK